MDNDPDTAAHPMTSSSPLPSATVLLLVGSLRHRAERCLRAVLASDAAPLEVLLLDVAPELPPIAGSDHPLVRRLPLPADTEFGPARALGVREARGEIVAFLEEHSEPCAGWLSALQRAFGEGWSGVGPCIVNGNPDVGFSNLTYALGYGLFAPPVRRGPTVWIPSHNSAFRRDALLGLGDDLPELLGSENAMRKLLWRDGHRFSMEPDSRVRHWNEAWLRGTPALYFHYNRLAAAVEHRLLPGSLWRRIATIVAWPLIPPYALWLLGRRLRRVPAASRPIDLGELARTLPHFLAIHGLGAFGRALGSLGWIGRASAGFTELELTLPRDPADLEVLAGLAIETPP